MGVRSRNAVRYASAAGFALLMLGAAGCNTPPGSGRAGRGTDRPVEIDAAKVETRDDITEINQFWPVDPWARDADGTPVGFVATVYFVSGTTKRGAFVPGKISVNLYTLDRTKDRKAQRTLVRSWDFPVSQSVLFRVRKLSQMGYHYGFPLTWGPELDLAGKEIEVVFAYERLDGRVLTAPGRRFRVPLPGAYEPPVRYETRTIPPTAAPASQPAPRPTR